MLDMLPFAIFFVALPLWVLTFVFYARSSISCTAGMMGAMTMGMSVGLSLGTWIALAFSLPLFHSIMIGMALGGLAGTLAGLPISLMAVLDGMLSGGMAGMMGAMTGEMIADEYGLLLLKVTGILTGGVLFLLFIMLQSEVKRDELQRFPSMLRKPAWMFALILLAGLGIEFVHALPSIPNTGTHTDHSQHFSLLKVSESIV